MGDDINITFIYNDVSIKTSVEKEDTIGAVKQFLAEEHKIDPNCSLYITDDQGNLVKIDTGDPSVAIRQLELTNGEEIYVKKDYAEDVDHLKPGIIYILNGSGEEWKATLFPNTERQKGEREREFGVTGPSFAVPVVGEIKLGAFNFKQGAQELVAADLPDKETEVKIKPHQVVELPYTRYIGGTGSNACRLQLVDSQNQNFQEKLVKDGASLMITTTNEVVDGGMRQNPITRRRRVSWKPKHPPMHKPNLSYDPHQDLSKTDICPICNI